MPVVRQVAEPMTYLRRKLMVMKGNKARRSYPCLAVVIALALAGCATGPTGGPSAAKSQADLLMEAGFIVHTPRTSQGLAYVRTLPAKKVVLNQYQEKPLYLVCTDPDSRQCYLGSKAAYERYQQLAIQNSFSADQRNVSEHRWDPEALQMWVNSQGGG
jgi:hypothetical protein